MEEAADEELLLELLEERERAEEAEGNAAAAAEEEDVAYRASPSEDGALELSLLPPPAPVPVASQARTAAINELKEEESITLQADESGDVVVETPSLQMPAPPALVSSNVGRPGGRDGASEWSSSRRTASHRASAGNIRHLVVKETHSRDIAQESTTRNLNSIGHTEQNEEKKNEPPGANDEEQTQGPQLPQLVHNYQDPPTPKPVDRRVVSPEQSEQDAHLAPDKEMLNPGSEEQKVESSGSPPTEPKNAKGYDTDEGDCSIVCMSPPNDEREQSIASAEPTITPASNETDVYRADSTDSAVASLHHTFMTEVHESSSHDPNTVETTTTEPASSFTNDEKSEQQETPPATLSEPETEWIACVTDTGECYYYNPQTQESQWTPPSRTTQVDHSPVVTGPRYQDTHTTVASSNSRDALFAAAAGVEPFASQMQAILQSGMSTHEVNDAGFTPLHVASQCGNTNIASLLLYYGARPDGTASSDDSNENSPLSPSPEPPLFAACRRNQVELIQLLLDYGAQLNATDRDGNSLLHASIASQSQDTLLFLLDLSSSSTELLNHRNHDGETPLHLAVKTGYTDAVRALLRYGAAMDVDDSLGRTPLVLSIMENQVECVQLLQTTSEKPNTESTKVYQETGRRQYDVAADIHPVPATPVVEEETMMTCDANLDQLQVYILQLLPSSMGNPELQQAVYQFCNQTQQQMGSLATELQVQTLPFLFNVTSCISNYTVMLTESDGHNIEQALKQHKDEQKAQIKKLIFENANASEELAKDRDELSGIQELLASQQLELDTLRASHQALTSRCEMLDGIARTAQEKLKRERAEHAHYEEHLQVHLRATLDENLRLVTNLNELEAKWDLRLEQERQQQQHQQSQAYSEEKSSRSGNEDDFYYHEYGDAAAQADEHPPYYGSTAEGTGTLMPVDEPSEYYDYDYDYEYSNENDNDDNDDNDVVYLNDSATQAKFERVNTMKAPATSTPPISPSRVGAVWNKFFENMAVAAERSQGSGGDPVMPPAHTQQQSRSNNAGYTSASSSFTSSPASIFMAIRKNNFAELQQLLLAEISPNVRDIGEKGTPLHLACELGDLDAVKLLCEFAADVEVRDESDNTPLLVACSQSHYECTKFLLQSAANLLAVNANGDSALHLAAWDGSAACVEILFEYGIDPLAKNNFALTPLANIKTRSPLRHKFDDLVDEHPMRRTLVLLEEFEQQYEGQDDEDNEEEHQEPEHSIRDGDEHESALSRVTKQSSSANQASEKVETASKASWKEWLFSFGAKPKQEEAKEEQDDDQEERESGGEDDDHEDSSQERHEGSDGDEAHDEEEIGDATETIYSFEDSLRRYELLKPPPEIEVELQRAKLQLQRPAMLATRNYTVGDNGQPTSGREVPGTMHQQSFVAADRSRMTMAAQKKPAGSTPTSSHLRARYVDTFNPA